MICLNANGTHKFNLWVIGKAKNPKHFKNGKCSVDYKNQGK